MPMTRRPSACPPVVPAAHRCRRAAGFGLPLLALALLLVARPAPAAEEALAAGNAERAFSDARQWTVRVETLIPQPFIEDEQGMLEGSGLVVDARRGWVLTNAHVAGYSPGENFIAFDQGRRIPAERHYVDPHLDLAVLAFDPDAVEGPVPEPVLECERLPAVGHAVGAFGHPWGYRFTGTRGIASALTSRLGPDMLQTDAPINSGNSGGPLISLASGRVLGVNAAKISGSDIEGLSFAVPMPYACTLLELLRAGTDPSPPQPLVDFVVEENYEPSLQVARSRLPAGTLDLLEGDRILAVDARPVRTPTQFYDALRGRLERVRLRIERAGRERVLEGRWPPAPLVTERRALAIDGLLFAPGETVYAGTLEAGPRLMVHHLEPGLLGAEVQYYDVLLKVNGQSVHTLEDLEAESQRAVRSGSTLELLLLRLEQEGTRLFSHQRRELGRPGARRIGAW